MNANDDRPEKKSQPTKLVELAQALGITLFQTPDKQAFAVVERDGHRENWSLRSSTFENYLSQAFYAQFATVPTKQAVKDAIGVLEGQALFDSPEEEAHLRVAGDELAVYVDLANDAWEVVEIRPDGWDVRPECPVRFRRSDGVTALPYPERSGTLEELTEFLNLDSDGDRVLILSWLLGALNPRGPYPILVLNGEQGSAKSTTQNILRSLIDPSATPLRCEPTSQRDLVIAARNSWVLSFDNCSYVSESLSDSLCRIATGSGFTTRRLYTNDEETHFRAKRPTILNGIPELATRSDLLSRSILVTLPSIPAHKRRAEQTFWHRFEKARPRILGALFDTVSLALRQLPQVDVVSLPRLADFARWVIAAEPALGEPGVFALAYEASQAKGRAIALDSTPITEPIRFLVDQQDGMEGTAAEWLEAVRRLLENEPVLLRGLPKTPRGMGDAMRRIKPDLEAEGYVIDFEREAGGTRRRLIRIWPRGRGDERCGGDGPLPVVDPDGTPVLLDDGSPLVSVSQDQSMIDSQG